ncbi:MAG: hypothetical protein ACRDGS_14845 [Chloroflexota bacterium]
MVFHWRNRSSTRSRAGGSMSASRNWPLYTFVADKAPLPVPCHGVDGWHVFRVMH